MDTHLGALTGALSIPKFCNDYSIGRSLAYEEIASGRLKAVKIGRRTVIPVRNAEAWLRLLEKEADHATAA